MSKQILIEEIKERIVIKEFASQRDDLQIQNLSNPLSKCRWDALILSANCSPWLCEIKKRTNSIKEFWHFGAYCEVNKFNYLIESCQKDKAIEKNIQPYYINVHPPDENGQSIMVLFNLFNIPKKELVAYTSKGKKVTASDDTTEVDKTRYSLPFKYATLYTFEYPTEIDKKSEIIYNYLYL
jgi:hypothetical protein